MLRTCKQCKNACEIYAREMCRACYIKEFTEEKKSQGICTTCRCRPIDFERSNCHCAICFDREKIAYTKIKQQRLNDKCCVDCGVYTGGYYRCEKCSRRNSSYKMSRQDLYNELYKIQAYLDGIS